MEQLAHGHAGLGAIGAPGLAVARGPACRSDAIGRMVLRAARALENGRWAKAHRAFLSGKGHPSPETRPGGGKAGMWRRSGKGAAQPGSSGGLALSNSSGCAASRGRMISMASCRVTGRMGSVTRGLGMALGAMP